MDASRVIAIIGKTEGNGGVNDYTRIIADRAFREVLMKNGAPEEQVKGVPIVWSGGTDGVMQNEDGTFVVRHQADARRVKLRGGGRILFREAQRALHIDAHGRLALQREFARARTR